MLESRSLDKKKYPPWHEACRLEFPRETGLILRCAGKAARAGLRPARRQSRLPHSRSLLLRGENARSWEALGEALQGQSSLSAGALRYRAWA